MTAPGHPQDDRLLELAYGEVEGAEEGALRRHVDDCPRCRSVLDGIAEVRSAVRRVPPEPAPERGLESLLAYGELAAARARAQRRNVRWLGLLTLATAALLVFVLLPERRGQQGGTAPMVARVEPQAKLEAPAAPPPPTQADRAAEPAVASEFKASEKPRPKDAERKIGARRDEDLDAVAVAKKQVRQPEGELHAATAEEARRADSVAAALPPPAAADGLLQSAPRQEAKKEVAGQAQSASAGLARNKAATAPAKVASATPGPASSAPPAAVAGGAVPQLEKSRTAGSETEGSGVVGLLGTGAGADKSLGTVGAAGSGAKGAAGRSANVPAENAAGKASDDRAARLSRLAEVRRSVVEATGEQRKALLLEQCRLEAGLELRASAVGTCSQLAREFPGTPEAQQAVDLARGFSVQPPSPAP
jgi:hypothetical protein